MVKKKGLGRGLDALLGATAKSDDSQEVISDKLQMIPIDLLQRGKFQPRVHFSEDALTQLAQSIKAQGVVQPIVVRQIPGHLLAYEIIAGERRWRAAQEAGLAEIPAVVQNVNDAQALAIALIENIQREDLNPIEEAIALKRLVDEFVMTHEGVAEEVGRSRASVTNLLRLLELSSEPRFMVERGDLGMGHARALLGLPDALQTKVAKEVVARGLSVRETEKLVQRHKSVDGRSITRKADPDVQRLEEMVSEKLGSPTKIKHNLAGKGTLTIWYSSLDELDGILERIK